MLFSTSSSRNQISMNATVRHMHAPVVKEFPDRKRGKSKDV
jgi:hypothetical protein